MNNEIISTMHYKDLRLEYCIFENETLYVGRYLLDTRQYDTGISILGKYKVSKVVFPTSINLKIYRSFKESKINIELLDKKHFIVRKRYDEDLSLGCLNAMIYYLEMNVYKHHIGILNINNPKELLIGNVGNILVYKHNLNDFLYLDIHTIEDLSLKTELFGKINYTKTIYGKHQLLKYILFPLKKESEILIRHKNISDLQDKSITQHLKKIKGIETEGIINIEKLPTLLSSVISIAEILKNTSLKFSEIELVKKLLKFVDIFEGIELKKGLFPKYDQLVSLYNNLPEYLGEVAKNIIQDVDIELSIIYLPQLGYLIEIDKDADFENYLFDIPENYNTKKNLNRSHVLEKSLFSNSENLNNTDKENLKYKEYFDSRVNNISVVMEDFTTKTLYKTTNISNLEQNSCKFIINGKMYLKTKVMTLLDKEFGDLNNLIEEFKCSKINEIRDLIVKYPLDSVFDYIGFVDSINSLKHFSLQNKCCIPKISKEKKILLRRYWNYKVDIDFSKNVIFNGSNDFLKIIGEAVVLFHIGSHIPSAYAEFYLFDQIYSSINVTESIINDTSYFLASLKSIARIVNHATEDSLCLIGDLGYGTNANIGITLFKEVHKKIKEFFVISSCNFSEIFNHHNLTKQEKVKVEGLSTEIIIPDISYGNNLEMKHDSIIHSNMSSIYYKSESNDEDCLCTFYNFYSITINNLFISIIAIKELKDDSSSFINDLKLSNKFLDIFLESSEIIKNYKANDEETGDKWAIEIVNDFIRDHKDEIFKL